MNRRPLIAGNWKMNGLSAEGTALAQGVADGAGLLSGAPVDFLICPPFTLLSVVGAVVENGPVRLGAQDCHAKESGAHTGDVSALMLADIGCTHVIVGHSERRTDHGETDDDVRLKATAVQAAGMCAIVCIGETEAERDVGQTLDVVRRQLRGSLPETLSADNTVIAYEPVWAIGTGRTPTLDEVQEVHGAIRIDLRERFGVALADGVRLLYGGSMKPSNAGELLALPDVDGGLIGGASLKAQDFLDIAKQCLNS